MPITTETISQPQLNYEYKSELAISPDNLIVELGLDNHAAANIGNIMDIAAEWKPRLFQENMAYLKGILKYFKRDQPSMFPSDTYHRFNNRYFPAGSIETHKLSKLFSDYRQAKDIPTTLSEEMTRLSAAPAGQMAEYVCDLTSMHDKLADQLTILEGSEGIEPKDIGVIIIDNHNDSKNDDNLHKGSFGNLLLQKGYHIGLIGVSPAMYNIVDKERKKPIILPESVSARFESKDYKELHNPSFTNNDLQQMVEQLRQSGVKRIVISIDPDVVDGVLHGLTAWEYNSINILGILGVNNWKEVLKSFDFPYQENIEHFVAALNKLFHSPDPKKDKVNGDKFMTMMQGLSRMRAIDIDNKDIQRAISSPSTEFSPSPEEIKQSIRSIIEYAQEAGLEIGIPYTQADGSHRRYVGGVTELAGLDLNGNTARFALDLINTLITSIK